MEITQDEKLAEYKNIIDIFLKCGADVFVFETMQSTKPLDEAVKYLRQKHAEAFIICQFAVHPDSHTSAGIEVRENYNGSQQNGCRCKYFPITTYLH